MFSDLCMVWCQINPSDTVQMILIENLTSLKVKLWFACYLLLPLLDSAQRLL